MKYIEVYSDKEIETLFILLSKLYEGIDHLDKRITNGENLSDSGQQALENKEKSLFSGAGRVRAASKMSDGLRRIWTGGKGKS